MTTLTLTFDDDDADAIHRAIALRQSIRCEGESLLPDSDSDTAGTVLAEICRSWIESIERRNT